jgi:hypothetical protein
LDIQVDPLVNPTNIAIDNILDITLEPQVHPCMITNINAPQVVHQNPLNHEVARPTLSIEMYEYITIWTSKHYVQ